MIFIRPEVSSEKFGKDMFVLQNGIQLVNFYSLKRGTKAKTRGNTGHDFSGLYVIPSMTFDMKKGGKSSNFFSWYFYVS